MIYFIHCIETSQQDDGGLLFMCHHLGSRAAALTQTWALKFYAQSRRAARLAQCQRLAEFCSRTFVLKHLGKERVQLQCQRPEFVLPRIILQVDAALTSYSWHEVFGFDAIDDDEDLCEAMVWMFVFVTHAF